MDKLHLKINQQIRELAKCKYKHLVRTIPSEMEKRGINEKGYTDAIKSKMYDCFQIGTTDSKIRINIKKQEMRFLLSFIELNYHIPMKFFIKHNGLYEGKRPRYMSITLETESDETVIGNFTELMFKHMWNVIEDEENGISRKTSQWGEKEKVKDVKLTIYHNLRDMIKCDYNRLVRKFPTVMDDFEEEMYTNRVREEFDNIFDIISYGGQEDIIKIIIKKEELKFIEKFIRLNMGGLSMEFGIKYDFFNEPNNRTITFNRKFLNRTVIGNISELMYKHSERVMKSENQEN